MNTFDRRLQEAGHYPLTAREVSTLQVNIGYTCNLRCTHCHVDASPERKERMPLATLSRVLDVLKNNDQIGTVDITGGSPELYPYLKYFVKSCKDLGKKIIVRTNLAVLTEKETQGISEFLAEHKVRIVASLPCYSEENVDKQRGKGTFKKAIAALRHLNSLGYGREGSGLVIDIMFNPSGAAVAPDQSMLESSYKKRLRVEHGITFNRLIALSNMPIGRLGNVLSEQEKKQYVQLLDEQFNSVTLPHVMCRNLVSVAPDGRLYDCDFWQMLGIPMKGGARTIEDFHYPSLKSREIATNSLCLMCTSGAGASCNGALT